MNLLFRTVPDEPVSVFTGISWSCPRNADSIQVTKHTAFADVQGVCNFRDLQASIAEFEGSFGDGFGGAGFSALIDATSSGDSDSGGLSFPAIFEFDFCQSKHDSGDPATDGTSEINLLSDRYNSDALLTPVGQNIDAVLESAGKSIEFPDDDGSDLAREDRLLKLFEGRSLDGLAAFVILKPLHGFRIQAMTFEPPLNLGFLAVGLLLASRDPAIAGEGLGGTGFHDNKSKPFLAGCHLGDFGCNDDVWGLYSGETLFVRIRGNEDPKPEAHQ